MRDQKKHSAHIIVFGNEKGGSGKSTSAMHAAIALLRAGHRVGSIDLDARQGTFSRYLRNRFETVKRTQMDLPSPTHMAIERSKADNVAAQNDEERAFLEMALYELAPHHDYIVIDTPGTDSYLSRLAHSYADTLVTPMNDSFIDLDLLAHIDADSDDVITPSIYTKMVWEQRQIKMKREGCGFDWVVMRNRLSHLSAKNKEHIGRLIEKIGQLYGFRVAPGFGERVIFRELFLKGMTLLDLQEDVGNKLTLSQVSARQEVRNLIMALDIQDEAA